MQQGVLVKALLATMIMLAIAQADAAGFEWNVCVQLRDFFNMKVEQAQIAEEKWLNADRICKGRSSKCHKKLEKKYKRALENVVEAEDEYLSNCR
jgi:hypothetical protein